MENFRVLEKIYEFCVESVDNFHRLVYDYKHKGHITKKENKMKTKVVLSKAQKVSTIAVMAAIAGVIGLGGLALTSGDVNAAPATSNKTTTSGNSGSPTGGSSSTTKPATSSNSGSQSTSTSGQTTTTPTTTTASTPNTGLFTGDDEFTQADGIIIVTGLLAVALGSYVIFHNRKTIFRGRVNFDKR